MESDRVRVRERKSERKSARGTHLLWPATLLGRDRMPLVERERERERES